MDEQELYKNSKKEEIILEVRPYLYNLDGLLSKMSGEIVKGIKANSTTSLKFYITIRFYDEKGYTITGDAIVTDYDGKTIGRCLLLRGPIRSTIFCENIQENIGYKLSNPDHYLSNIITIIKNIFNTVHSKEEQIIELQANINLNSIPHDPKITVYRPLETISYNNNISEIKLYNPEIIPLVKY
ncbi:MAG: hypothetical protein RQ869_01460 [Candidatus Nanopusillus sp.]|nr:hypothetical protein [Candidatus Nanopusillus sp.]